MPGNAAACNNYSQTLCNNNFPYYPAADYLPSNDNLDPSCGLPTLDYMKANYCDVSAGLGNCPSGYYLPNEHQYVHTYSWDTTDPLNPQCIRDTTNHSFCGYIGADYFRVPIDRGNPDPTDCHWGLVGDPAYDFTPIGTGQTNTELTNDQARAFLFCVYGLSPADIVDPWLNGYTWGCNIANGCATGFPDSDPHFHKFFSAGPDKTVNTADDIIAPL